MRRTPSARESTLARNQPSDGDERDAEFRFLPSAWCWEAMVAAAGLLILSPVLLAIAIAIRLEDGAPILFRQKRVGHRGVNFDLLKFRTMRRRQGQTDAMLTASGDPRVTRVGRFLRNYKLDELLQLWNVVRGEMRLIGPRPEVPRFVNVADPAWRTILQVKPGITDLATLVYRNEEAVLATYQDVERGYREMVLPAKLTLNREYLRHRSLWRDIKLLILTVRYSLAPAGFDSQRVKQTILGE